MKFYSLCIYCQQKVKHRSKKNQFWDYAEEQGSHFRCKFCECVFPRGATRIKAHLAGVTTRKMKNNKNNWGNIYTIAFVGFFFFGCCCNSNLNLLHQLRLLQELPYI